MSMPQSLDGSAHALAEIVSADPDAREPWLVLGDWLSSAGDPRGEAIVLFDRLQRGEGGPAERAQIAERYRALCAPDRLLAEIEHRGAVKQIHWRHGLPIEATFDDGPRGFAAFSALCRRPAGLLLRVARFRLVGKHVSELLADTVALGQLSELDLGQNSLGDEGAEQIAAHADLPRLARLKLHQNGIGARGLRALVAAGGLGRDLEVDLHTNRITGRDLAEIGPKMAAPRFSGLSLSGNPVDDDGCEGLSRWDGLGALRTLDLSFTSADPQGFERLVASGHLSGLVSFRANGALLGGEGLGALLRSFGGRLRELELSGTAIGPEGLRALAQAELPELRRVDLSRQPIGDEGVRVLASGEVSRRIVSFSVSHAGIGPEGVAAIAQRMHALEDLSLSNNRIEQLGIEALASAPLARLRSVVVRGCTLYSSALGALAREGPLPRLDHIDLSYNGVGPDGLAALASSGRLLRQLGLAGNAVGHAGAEILARSLAAHRLVSLDLSENHVGDRGAAALAQSEWLWCLRSLSLRRDEIGTRGAVALATSRSLCSLTELDLRDNRPGDKGTAVLRAQSAVRVLL